MADKHGTAVGSGQSGPGNVAVKDSEAKSGNLGQEVADSSGNQSDNPNEPQSTYEGDSKTQEAQAEEYKAYEPKGAKSSSSGPTGPTARK